jgi:Bacteriophage tail sheath protein
MERLHPGVYVEEVPSGVRPIEGVSTSTAAFFGRAERGSLDGAHMVTSFTEFEANYGSFLNDSYLAHAALHFFNNGGRRLYIVRVAKDAGTATVGIADRQAAPALTMTIAASSAGGWGNTLEAVVGNGTADAGDEFRFTIRQGSVVAETFDNLSMNPDALNFAELVVNASSRLVRVTVAAGNDSTTAGTSISAGSAATTLPVDRRKLRINLNADGPQTLTLADPVTTGGEIATAIQAAVRALTPLRASTPGTAYSGFTAAFAAGVYTLTSGAGGKRSSVVVTNDPTANAATLLKLGVTNGGTEATGAAALRPANGTFLLGDGTVAGATLSVTPGSDGTTPQPADYINAISMLDPVGDVNIIAVPGIGSRPVVEAGSNYCQQRRDCFYVADMTATDDTKEEAQTYVNSLTVKSSYAALYFPWLKMVDPTGGSPDPIAVPPSGFVTGTYARIDARRGVFKAPAGTEANIAGAVGVAKVISDAEQDMLNPIGVNAIRFFPASGLVVWGARTLATQSDPEYRYVPIRRFAIFLEQSIYRGIQWAVFEPNGEDLWASLRLNIGAFMMTQFRSGAFQGDTPAKAFFVKCDAETNPQDQINAGIVTVLVGFAPLRPAEFVVIRISQKTAEAAA